MARNRVLRKKPAVGHGRNRRTHEVQEPPVCPVEEFAAALKISQEVLGSDWYTNTQRLLRLIRAILDARRRGRSREIRDALPR